MVPLVPPRTQPARCHLVPLLPPRTQPARRHLLPLVVSSVSLESLASPAACSSGTFSRCDQPAATPHAAAATSHAAAAAPYSIVVTQHVATLHAAAATPQAAAVALRSTVMSQPAAVLQPAACTQLASTFQRASSTLPTKEELATVEKPDLSEKLQSSRRCKSLAKARPNKRAASKHEASAFKKESLPGKRPVALLSSKSPRLAEFKYTG